MTIAQPSASRRSRFLFEWDAARCLAAPEQSLDAVTGQAATFTRASVKYALDAAGRYYAVAHSLPAFEWATDPVSGLMVPAIRLDAQSTNLVIQSDVCTVANGWTATGTTTPTADNTFAGRPFTSIANVTGGALFRTVAFTGNGTKAFSFLIRQYAAVSGTTKHLVFDSSASATRATITCTIAANGTVTAVGTNGGTVLWVQALGDGAYRVWAQATGVIAANANRVYASDAGGATASSFLISGIQAENGAVPSALLPTTTATVTAGLETLSYSLKALPAGSTWYVKFFELGTILTGLSSGLIGIGASNTPASLFFLNDSSGKYTFEHREATDVFSTIAATSPTLGQSVELRGVLGSTGTALLGQSINGGAESLATQSSALALPAAWFDTTLTFNDRFPGGGAPGFTGIQQVRIAAAGQALAYMRTG